MFRQLLSKKLWISVLSLSMLFILLTYVWLYYLNQWVLQAERETWKQEQVVTVTEEVAAAAQQMAEPIEMEVPSLTFPCTMKMKDGQIGLYNQDGVLCQELKQSSEYLSEQDRIQLIQGITAENKQELVLLCESYHLQ